jgi:hypothetical protein
MARRTQSAEFGEMTAGVAPDRSRSHRRGSNIRRAGSETTYFDTEALDCVFKASPTTNDFNLADLLLNSAPVRESF